MNHFHFRVTLLAFFLFTHLLWGALPKASTLAILPFENQGEDTYDWLEEGFSHVLISKFSRAGSLRLLEREHIQKVLEDSQAWEKSPELKCSLLGSDYLLMGSFVVLESTLKVQTRIVHSTKTTILPESLVSEQGKLEEILDLEDRLAKVLVQKMGVEVEKNRLEKRVGEYSDSHILYLKGRKAYEDGLLEEGLSLVMEAQVQNQGLFFEKAHALEGQIRIEMARKAETEERKKIIQKEHLNAFRAHAAEASHAFFDLGIAQQSQGLYGEAIASYQRFMQWCSEKSKLFLWKTEARMGRVNTPEAPGYYDHGKRFYDQNDCWCCRQYVFRGWTMEKDHSLLIRGKEGTRDLVCKDNFTGDTVWKTETLPIGRLDKMILLSQDGFVFLVTNHQVQVFEEKAGKLIKSFPIRNEIENGKHVMLPQAIYDKEGGVLAVYNQLLNEEKGEYGFYLRAYDLEKEAMLWDRKAFDLPHRQGTLGFWQGKMVLLQNGQLELLEPQSGRVLSRMGPKGDLKVVAYWPGKDHLLLRFSHRPRGPSEDRFWCWMPEAQGESFAPEQKILFTYQTNYVLHGMEEMVVPIVDREIGVYRNIPAHWLLPKTAARGNDKYDGISGNPDVTDSINHPWVRLQGKRLWIWDRNRFIHLFDADSGELLWRHYLPDSGGGMDVQGGVVSVRLRGDVIFLNAEGEQLNYRSLEAQIRIAQSQEALGQTEDMVKSYEGVIDEDRKNITAHLALADYHERQGNLPKASWHHDHVLRFGMPGSPRHENSRQWLANQLGLVEKISTKSFRGQDFFGDGIIFMDRESGLHHKKFGEKMLTTLEDTDALWWGVEGDVFVSYNHKQDRYRFYDRKLNLIRTRSESEWGNLRFSKVTTSFTGAKSGLPYRLTPRFFIHSHVQDQLRVTPADSQISLWEAPYTGPARVASNGNILVINQPLSHHRRENRVSAYALDRSLGKLGTKLWETGVENLNSVRQSKCVVVGEEVLVVTDDYNHRERGGGRTSTLHRLSLMNGELISRSSAPKVSIEGIFQRGGGPVTMTVWKKSTPRSTVWYQPGMEMKDLYARKGVAYHGAPLMNSLSKKLQIIAGNGSGHSEDQHNITLTDGKTGKLLWNGQPLATRRPSSFIANEDHISFFDSNNIYILETRRFLEFIAKDLKGESEVR